MQVEKEQKTSTEGGKVYTVAPLPFQGQKRNFVKEFKTALEIFCGNGEITTIVDLFGGSGLLAHTAKRLYPECRVIYNDFDDFHVRLENVERTNRLLAEIRTITAGIPKHIKLDGVTRERILGVVRSAAGEGFVDYITLSSSLLFSAKYVLSLEALGKETLYNNVIKDGYRVAGYLNGLELVKMDYDQLAGQFKGRKDVLFVVDPPYLSTDTKTYLSEGYWRLKDYLDVLKVITTNPYVFFTSEKSSLVELCEWLEQNRNMANPFYRAQKRTYQNTLNYHAKYTDIMLYRRALKECG